MQNFLALINEERIDKAKENIKNLLGFEDLKDKLFLDIGCGSGLFSLAARKLGATVISYDFDHKSVNVH